MEFSVKLANQLMLKEIGNEKNCVLSPLSLNLVQSIVAAGATGPTLKHMLGYLGSEDVDEIKSKSMEMMAVAAGADGAHGGPILTIVNGMWAGKRFPLKPSYQQVVRSVFNCEVNNVDFETKADEVIHEINSWVKAASRGIFKDLLNHDDINPVTVLVIINGLYFKGSWREPFHPLKTHDRSFYLLNGDSISVPFMTEFTKYHCGSFDGFKVLKIPYKNGELLEREFSMYFFLPDERDGLQDLLEKFNSNPEFLLENLSLKKEWIHKLGIPKFKFSYGFDVHKAMKDMGVSSPFIESWKDFEEMLHVPEGLPLVSKMHQKAFIEVDEKGTEAAAITCRCIGGGRSPPDEFIFIADHPFVFMIKEESSRLIFFTGAVLNPLLDN